MIELIKKGEDYEAQSGGVTVALIYKGWSRNGGAGWVANMRGGLQNISRAHKSLDSIKRAIADRVKRTTLLK